MRKLFFILWVILLLTGCAANVPAEETPAPAPAAEDGAAAPSVLRLQPFSDADSAAMSRFMSRGRYVIDGEQMYGLDFDESLRPVLAAYTLRGGRPEGFQILCDACVPEYLTLAGERLYFLHEGSVQCYDLPARARQTLIAGPCGSLQLLEDRLYYTDAEGRYCRAALDGSGSEVLIDAPCAYAYAMAEGVVYQREDEGERLRMRLWDGADRAVTAAASYAPLRLGDTIWYSQRDALGAALASIDLTDGTVRRYDAPEVRGEAELLHADGAWVLRVFLAGDGWKQQVLRPGESEGTDCRYSGYRLCDYVDGTLRVDAAYEADGRLRCFVLVGADGGELRFFGGKILD